MSKQSSPTQGRQVLIIGSQGVLEDPFEVDMGNAPHLAAREGLGLDDAMDVLFGDPEFYEDDSEGSADWLMVGRVPGGEILVVPIAQSNYLWLSKVRPITVLRAPIHIEQRYLDDKRGEA